MRKIFAILMALCLLTVFVSSASAWYPTKTTYTANSFSQQWDQAAKSSIIQTSTASGSASSLDFGCWKTPAGVDINQVQTGTVTSTTADAFQSTYVNAQGIDATASSAVTTDIHVGTECTTPGGCPPE